MAFRINSYLMFLSINTPFSVPNDEKGIDLNVLESIATKEKELRTCSLPGKPFWALFYLIPVFHNPTGRVLPSGKLHSTV